jgi:hypothetical protein
VQTAQRECGQSPTAPLRKSMCRRAERRSERTCIGEAEPVSERTCIGEVRQRRFERACAGKAPLRKSLLSVKHPDRAVSKERVSAITSAVSERTCAGKVRNGVAPRELPHWQNRRCKEQPRAGPTENRAQRMPNLIVDKRAQTSRSHRLRPARSSSGVNKLLLRDGPRCRPSRAMERDSDFVQGMGAAWSLRRGKRGSRR